MVETNQPKKASYGARIHMIRGINLHAPQGLFPTNPNNSQVQIHPDYKTITDYCYNTHNNVKNIHLNVKYI